MEELTVDSHSGVLVECVGGQAEHKLQTAQLQELPARRLCDSVNEQATVSVHIIHCWRASESADNNDTE